MAANGRRIKRRGSGRSGNSGEVELASLKASTEGTEHVSHLLESQKQAYEVHSTLSLIVLFPRKTSLHTHTRSPQCPEMLP